MGRWTNTQDITWFLDLERINQLDLDPPYQRKSVWSLKDQRYFLDTIFKNYPCPAVFIHKDISNAGKTTYHVVDGKQRLKTIINFSKDEISIDKQYGDTNLDGKKFSDLLLEARKQFWNYQLAVDFIDRSDDIKEIFDRYNRVSKNLTPQELRHAWYEGWFIKEAEEETKTWFWERVKISTKTRARRMQDTQSISEFLMVLIEKKISGFDQMHITRIYADYDDTSYIETALDVDSYLEEKKRVKEYISQMAGSDTSIIKWIRILGNFYTLWALVALYGDKLPEEPKVLALKYKAFMEKVDSIADSERQDLSNQEKQAYAYRSNSRGASADIKPRTERLNLLVAAMLDNEGSWINR